MCWNILIKRKFVQNDFVRLGFSVLYLWNSTLFVCLFVYLFIFKGGINCCSYYLRVIVIKRIIYRLKQVMMTLLIVEGQKVHSGNQQTVQYSFLLFLKVHLFSPFFVDALKSKFLFFFLFLFINCCEHYFFFFFFFFDAHSSSILNVFFMYTKLYFLLITVSKIRNRYQLLLFVYT